MKRLPLPDLLKGFAVFLIVPVHILETFIDYPGRETLFGKILLFLGGPVAVPVFMMVMGYFTAKNRKNVQQNLWRGIKVFGVGFLLNIGLNFHLLLKIRFAGWQIDPLEYIWGVDILYLAGLSLIFLSFLRLINRGKQWLAIVLLFAILLSTSVMNAEMMPVNRNYWMPFIAGTWSWSYFPVFPWLAYPLSGFAFFYFEEKILAFLKNQKWISGGILTVIAVMVLVFSKWGYLKTINLNDYYHHTFLYSLWAFAVVVLWAFLMRMIVQLIPGNPVVLFLRWLGTNITAFYIIQWLIIGNIATAIYQTKPISQYIFWFTGIFGITVLFTWLLSKTRIKLA